MKQSELIDQLIKTSKALNEEAQSIEKLQHEKLTRRPKEGAWNALECFEHLNLYIDIYNDFFDSALKKAQPLQENVEIKRGYWGNRFINWMEPKNDGTITKMNTFKSKNTMGQELDKGVIQHFIAANAKTIAFLELSKTFAIPDYTQVVCSSVAMAMTATVMSTIY